MNKNSNKMAFQHRSGPSIPGKTIKILKSSPHAEKVNEFLQGNLRYGRHKRGQSYQKDLKSTFSKDDVLNLANKGRPSSIMKEKRKGFATSSYRFDQKCEFERFFDSTPGPGSYNLMKNLTKRVGEITKDDSNFSQRMKSSSSHNKHMGKSLNRSSFINREYLFDPKDKGTFGSGRSPFTKENTSPGPGQYNNTSLEIESHRKRIIAPIFKDK